MQLASPATLGTTLKDLLRTDSARLFEDGPYLKARLSDRVPQSMREIPLIVVAQKAGVPQSLYSSPRTYSLRSSLIAKLQNDCGLSQDAASWAVACWASAFDITFMPDAPPKRPLPEPGAGTGPVADWTSGPVDTNSQHTQHSPAHLMTLGALRAGIKRLQDENRRLAELPSEKLRKIATVAVIVDAAFSLIVTLSRTPPNFPAAATAVTFLMSAVVVTFALLFNTRNGKIFARILLVGSGIMLMFDVYALATMPGFIDMLGMLLDGVSFYMCFRVGFERTVPTQPQQIHVEMRQQ